ncbi:MAG: hypothetical protein ACOYVK_20215 [Bacillota bacterium]
MSKVLVYSFNINIVNKVVIPSLKNLNHDVDFINVGRTNVSVDHYDRLVTLGWNSNIRSVVDNFNKHSKPLLCISDGYIKSNRDYGNTGNQNSGKGYFAITRNRLNAYGYHEYEENLPSDRWNTLNVPLKPWNTNGDYVLIAHQNEGDCLGRNRKDCFIELIKECKSLNREIIISTHPKIRKTDRLYKAALNDLKEFEKMGCIIKSGTKNLLPNSLLLATYDSNAAVDSVLSGKPIYTCGKTMADMVKSSDIHNLNYPDRSSWCNWIAYQQWTESEMLTGEAFHYFGF